MVVDVVVLVVVEPVTTTWIALVNALWGVGVDESVTTAQ